MTNGKKYTSQYTGLKIDEAIGLVLSLKLDKKKKL